MWQWEWPPEEHEVAGVSGPFVTLEGVAFNSDPPMGKG